MGRYPMQIQWLQRSHAELSTGTSWLLTKPTYSELLDFVLAAEVWQGLSKDHDCWAKEL
jgi:hypothetical protein